MIKDRGNGYELFRGQMPEMQSRKLYDDLRVAVAAIADKVMPSKPRGMLDRVGRVLARRVVRRMDKHSLGENITKLIENYAKLLASLSADEQGKAAVQRRELIAQYTEPKEKAVFEALEELINKELLVAVKMYTDSQVSESEMKPVETVEMMPRPVEWLTQKKARGEAFNERDLRFIYGIGRAAHRHSADSVIKKLRAERADSQADIPLVFGCKESQIAREPAKIDKNTIVYVGPIFNFSEILKKFPNLEHIYTSFPERKICRDQVTINGTPANEMETQINQKGFKVYPYSRKLMDKIPLREGSEKIDLICLTVGDLGFTKSATLKEICDKAKEFGLDVCPPEVGPHYRLAYDNQPMNEYLTVATETISDSAGSPRVFSLGRDAGGVWLSSGWARPGYAWDPGSEFVFRLRK